jgi:hypothetical protein
MYNIKNEHVTIKHFIGVRLHGSRIINKSCQQNLVSRFLGALWVDAMELDFLVTGAAQGIGYEFSRFDLSSMSSMLINIPEHIINRVRRYFFLVKKYLVWKIDRNEANY